MSLPLRKIAAEAVAATAPASDLDAALYLFEMLSALRRVAIERNEPFLAYLIEMAASEASRLAGGRAVEGDG